MSHSMPWGAAHPGCVIFLLDRSASMDNTFHGKIGEGRKLKDAVATVLNNCLDEMGRRCIKGDSVSPRVDVAVIGYGGNVESALGGALTGGELVSIVDIVEKPLRTETRTRKEMDDTGSVHEIPVDFPIWVEPVSSGGTPMAAALGRSKEIAERWIPLHNHSFPPLIINITDGAATDSDPREPAKEIRDLSTSDGEALLFNCHISATNANEALYPGPGDQLPPDTFAPILFEMSSEIPDGMRNLAKELGVKSDMKPGDRGFVFNTDASGVMKMIQFATVQAISATTEGGVSADKDR